ncbi:FAD/NAD(P)-binding domain-containing protein [Auricularia subglabra TFB-10046 SS5]|uniref:FAD/NAD(P)-binding domain-containing protein n=1 Tax=Auricularia subglabra (strain TFB-10046 / SS5) TaxID=717982 RepID=J0WX72_AURST|nr:FAD/NAD(P)-binding domain-containing protein [Auricularia subglabra TFB-10046 SS5]
MTTTRNQDQLPRDTDVLVVGAGPAGLASAISLATHGVRVVIVDALAEGLKGARAAIVHAHTLEELDSLHCAAPLVAAGIPSPTIVMYDERGRPLVTVAFNELKDDTRYPIGLLISQTDVERILADRLAALGVRVYRSKRVSDMRDVKRGLCVQFESGEQVTAAYVVAADGSRSTIRQLSGIRFLDPHTLVESIAAPTAPSLALADVILASPLPASVPRDRAIGRFSAHGFIMLIPLRNHFASAPEDENLFRIVANARAPPREPDVKYMQALLDERVKGARALRVLGGSRYRARSALAEHLALRRGDGWVLLAGDSAHAHSPAGGQGMNLGLCDGVLLGKAIATHLNGDPAVTGGDAVFERWAANRRAVAAMVINVAERATDLAKVSGSWSAAVRGMVLKMAEKVPGVGRAIAWRISGLAWKMGDAGAF